MRDWKLLGAATERRYRFSRLSGRALNSREARWRDPPLRRLFERISKLDKPGFAASQAREADPKRRRLSTEALGKGWCWGVRNETEWHNDCWIAWLGRN